MRRKFFLIVFAFLLVSICVVSTLQILFFENERQRLIDQRLETVASSLIASGLSLSMIQNLESTDDLINDLLGKERVDYIINVYSLDGTVLAQNFTATEFNLRFSPNEVLQSYEANGQPVRVLNIKKGRLVVQAGVILGPSLFNPLFLSNSRFMFFTLFVFILLVISAFFSSGILFSPLRNLTGELQAMSAQLERKLGQPLHGFVIGPELARLARRRDAKDDFEKLCAEIESFLKKLEGYTRSFNAQTAILTHELKTPLTVLNNYLQELKRAPDLDSAKDLGSKALEEIDRLTQLINDFLQWSVLSANPAQPTEIYAVKMADVASQVVGSLNAVHFDRIELQVQQDCLVFALPDHVRQVLMNLLTNALNYSEKRVICRVESGRLVVEDQGRGMPEDVRQHLGSPFNRGLEGSRSGKGSGLGLAWVHSLCEKYSWTLQIESGDSGTKIVVIFDS